MAFLDIIRNGKGTAGAWRVESVERDPGVTCRQLWHYSTRMLEWRADNPADSAYLDWSLGWCSVSDQQAMNRAFSELRLPYWFSRRHGEILSLNVEEDRARMPLHYRRWAEIGRGDLLPAGWPRDAVTPSDPLRAAWLELRRDGSTRMTFEEYRACTAPAAPGDDPAPEVVAVGIAVDALAAVERAAVLDMIGRGLDDGSRFNGSPVRGIDAPGDVRDSTGEWMRR